MRERGSFTTRVVSTIAPLALLSMNGTERPQAGSGDELFPVGWKGKIEDAQAIKDHALSIALKSKGADARRDPSHSHSTNSSQHST